MMHIVGKIVWLITALASIAIAAASVFGFDLWSAVPMNVVQPMNIIIGIAGVLSLLMCFQKCMHYQHQHQCACNKPM